MTVRTRSGRPVGNPLGEVTSLAGRRCQKLLW